jgi:hypothetical protein
VIVPEIQNSCEKWNFDYFKEDVQEDNEPGKWGIL